MYITELFEAQDPSSVLVVYPGRFQPWHKGHKMVYDHLVKIYGRDNVFIATSNKVEPPRSPFTFSEKQQFMHLTGVSADRIVETRDPYRALEIVQKYNPKTTRLVFAVSEKDMAEDPRFKFGYKKDGSPTYFQQMPKNVNDMQPFETHGYIMTVPTFNFTVLGEPMKSATEVRAQFAQADEATQQAIVKDLFGAYDRHVHDIMKHKLSQTITESIAVGTKLDLTKNYGNFETLIGVVKDITPSGKLKIQIAQADPVPGKKGAVRVGDVITMAANYVKKTVTENFADGKNPQDKGDAKRHGVPTKASVSTLRKVAKQGGRKGQLAHWMANMKAGKAKAKNEGAAVGLNEFAPGGGSDDEKSYLLLLAGDLYDALYGPNKNAREVTNVKSKIESAGGTVKISFNPDSSFNVVMYHPKYFKQGHLISLTGNNGQQGIAEDNLNEFAPGAGGGESGRWYTDDQMTDIVGDGWWQDLDISGNIPKQAMIQEAQAWLDDQGYSVQVLNVRLNDDDTDWFIEGSFNNPNFAKKGMAEGDTTKKLSGATPAPAPNPYLKDILIRHIDEVRHFVQTGYIDPTRPLFQEIYEYFANEIPESVRRSPGRLMRRIGDMIAPYAKFYAGTQNMNEQGVAEGIEEDPLDLGSDYALYIADAGRKMMTQLTNLSKKIQTDSTAAQNAKRWNLGDYMHQHYETDDLGAINQVFEEYGVGGFFDQNLYELLAGWSAQGPEYVDTWKQYSGDVLKNSTRKPGAQSVHEQGVAEGELDEAKIASTEEAEDFFRNGKKVGSITKVTLKSGIIFYRVQAGNSYKIGADTRQEALRDLKRLLRDQQGVAEGDENQYRRPSSIAAAKISQKTNAKLNPTASKFVWKRPNQIGGSFSEQDLISKGFKKSQYNSWGGTQAMWNRLTTVGEQLDRPTPTAQQILDKHNLSVEDFIAQLRLGVKVELEHTKDAKIAYEIALDHLNERPDYYTVLARTGLEEAASGYIPTEAEKDDPRFKTALTVDVRPGTDKKNMRALRLIK